MSDEPSVTVAVESDISWSFWARKLHSLSGIVPIGVFLLEHIWTNSHAVYGAESFNEAVKNLQSLPYVILLEIGIIVVPLLYHGLYGLLITSQARPNNMQYNRLRNWMYLFQRVTGVILLCYIVFHVIETRVAMAVQGRVITFEYMEEALRSPWLFWFYFAGMVSAVYHFANGIWSFLVGWGITTTEKSMRRSGYVCAAIGLVLALFAVNSLFAFVGKAIVIKL
ncbi:MAG: succinate dehydrogenase [Bdellovibrionota bacterium]